MKTIVFNSSIVWTICLLNVFTFGVFAWAYYISLQCVIYLDNIGVFFDKTDYPFLVRYFVFVNPYIFSLLVLITFLLVILKLRKTAFIFLTFVFHFNMMLTVLCAIVLAYQRGGADDLSIF